MNVNKSDSLNSLQSDLKRVDMHTIDEEEYTELPELTDEMLARAKVRKGGKLFAIGVSKSISVRLPAEVVARWKATGPEWKTRIVELLSQAVHTT